VVVKKGAFFEGNCLTNEVKVIRAENLMLLFQKHPKLLNYSIQQGRNQESISSLKSAEKRTNRAYLQERKKYDEAHSPHLFLIGVAYKPDIIVQVPQGSRIYSFVKLPVAYCAPVNTTGGI